MFCVKSLLKHEKTTGYNCAKTLFTPINFYLFYYPYCGFQPTLSAHVAVVTRVTKTQRATAVVLLYCALQPGSRPLAAAMEERVIPTVIEVGADAVPSVRLYKKSAQVAA